MEWCRGVLVGSVIWMAASLGDGARGQSRDWLWHATHGGGHLVFDTARGVPVQVGSSTTTVGYAGGIRTLANQPPMRWYGSTTYDERRKRTVMFGGVSPQALHDDTWEFDGATWRQRTVTVRPPARSEHVLAYDPIRGVVVMHGGRSAWPRHRPLRDTWEFDGVDWTLSANGSGPGVDAYAGAMTFDPATSSLLLLLGRRPQLTINATLPVETWLWNGTAWQQATPSASPPVEHGFAMATDRRHRNVVLFGGARRPYGACNADTWIWNGRTWRKSRPQNRPPARSYHGMAFDDVRQRVIVTGGGNGVRWVLSDWEWDGTDWRQIGSHETPTFPGGEAMAFDETRGEAVLFGGNNGIYASGLPPEHSNDTWLWRGGTWHRATPTSAPSPRAYATMAYDHARARVVLFGGTSDRGVLDDTWEWDGSTWSRLSTRVRPPARVRATSAYDPINRTILLFGGEQPNSARFDDTWSWNGHRWRRHSATAGMPSVAYPAMASDLARRCVTMSARLVYGGWATWEWNGHDWLQRSTGLHPEVTYNTALAYDSIRRQVVMHTGGYRGHLWTWNGTQWSRLAPGAGDPHVGTQLVFDPVRDRFILRSRGSTVLFGDVSEPSATPRGTGCGGATVPQLAADQIWLERDCRVELVNGPTLAPALIFVSPNRTNVPVPSGCALLALGGIARFTVTNHYGTATFTAPVGTDPAVIGAELSTQGAVLDPTAPLGVALTAGLDLVVAG